MKTFAIVALVVILTAVAVTAQSRGGGSCPIPGIGNFECPTYSFNTSSYGVEFRDYDKHYVALCPLYGYYPLLEAQAVAICYPDLDAYFNGENSGRESILRTSPVSQFWEYDPFSGYHFYYTLFYIPVALTSPPNPVGPYVYLASSNFDADVATIPFSPNVTALDQEIINLAVFQLSYLLNSNRVPFYTDAHHVSWYQPPFLPPRNLRNEIWAFPIRSPNATVTLPYSDVRERIKANPSSLARKIDPKVGEAALKKMSKKSAK